MDRQALREGLIQGWVGLNGRLKDSQMTRELTYNEAVTMKVVYDRYRADGQGRTAVGELLAATHMLKSLMNRTLNALCRRGYLVKERQGRSLYVRPSSQGLENFLPVHQRSLELAERVIAVIGEEDARAFTRICQKLAQADLGLD